MDKSEELKYKIIEAGYKAVEELIKVAEDIIIRGGDDDLSSDKLKNAAATKRLAVEDSFAILNRIELEKELINGESKTKEPTIKGFAEGRSK
jgi:hypothetical protein